MAALPLCLAIFGLTLFGGYGFGIVPVALFVMLFAFEFVPRRKLLWLLSGVAGVALCIGFVVLVGGRLALFILAPNVLLTGILFIVLRSRGRKRARIRPGRAARSKDDTADDERKGRKPGLNDPNYDHARPGLLLKRGEDFKAKGLAYRIP